MPDEVLRLEPLCVAIAQLEDTAVSEAQVGNTLDGLARQIEDQVDPNAPPDRLARQLGEAMHGTLGFSGEGVDWKDASSSFLPKVLARRRGLPILLGAAWMLVGERIGVTVSGVNWPGRFLVSIDRPGARIFVDPYQDGRIRHAEDLISEEGVDGRSLLRPATPRAIAARMLTNLKHLWLEAEAWSASLEAIDRILLLLGEDEANLRDRGLVALHLGRNEEARRDLARYLALAPDSPDAESIRGVLARIEAVTA